MLASVAALERRDRSPRCCPAVSRSSCRLSASSTGDAPDTQRRRPCGTLALGGSWSPVANTSVTCACARSDRDAAPRNAGGGRLPADVEAVDTERIEPGRPRPSTYRWCWCWLIRDDDKISWQEKVRWRAV